MTQIVRVQVQLWSTEEAAVDAVRRTIEQAPLSAALEQEGNRFYIVGTTFAVWAAEKQGYVRAVKNRG